MTGQSIRNDALFSKIHSLATACLEGDAEAIAFEQLNDLVSSNPEALDIYVEYLDDSISLSYVPSTPADSEAMTLELFEDGATDISGNPLVCLPGQVSTFPLSGIFTNAFHGTIGFFSHEIPFSFLIGALLTGLLVLVAWLVPVSRQTEIVNNSSPTPLVNQRHFTSDPKMEIVGRITGMVDCMWSDINTSTERGNGVPLGRKYALASGLMEITYNTGAKVILQGPVTYEAESNGGYLSLGKLTGKLEKKVASAKISSPQPLAPSPFVITTPTATVTDLGTEFGVEVSKEGNTTSHVFRGAVNVQSINVGGEPGQVIRLVENESVRVDERGRTVRQPMVDAVAFVRSLPQRSVGKDIPVNNGDFESPMLGQGCGKLDRYGGWYNQDAKMPTGWQKTGVTGILSGGNTPIRSGISNGGQWGFCNAEVSTRGSLYQVVAVIDPAIVEYTVTADVAVQKHIVSDTYRLSLWAGAGNEPVTYLASITDIASAHPTRVQVTSSAPCHAKCAGQNLFVRFEDVGTLQVLIDNVRVTARRASNSPTIERR